MGFVASITRGGIEQLIVSMFVVLAEKKRIDDQQLMLVITVITFGKTVADSVLMEDIDKISPIICNQAIDNLRMTVDSKLVVVAIFGDTDLICPSFVLRAKSPVIRMFFYRIGKYPGKTVGSIIVDKPFNDSAAKMHSVKAIG